MQTPLVPERVWVSGNWDEFVASGADYTTNVNPVGPAADSGSPQEDMPPQMLLVLREIEAAQAHRSSLEAVRRTLRCSERCFYRSRETIWHLREVLRTTLASIHKSQMLIAASDQLIARSMTLGCDSSVKAEGDRA